MDEYVNFVIIRELYFSDDNELFNEARKYINAVVDTESILGTKGLQLSWDKCLRE